MPIEILVGKCHVVDASRMAEQKRSPTIIAPSLSVSGSMAMNSSPARQRATKSPGRSFSDRTALIF